MKLRYLSFAFLAALAFACNDEKGSGPKDGNNGDSTQTGVNITEEPVSYTTPYTSDSISHNGYIVYDQAKQGRRPIVLVVHEWWGVGDYARRRARQLAELGYLAMAVDMYGGQKQGPDPEFAGKLATPFYQNPELTRQGLDAALAKVKQHAQADTTRMAAIGYCFGGYTVLNAARLGTDFKGVVSFHGDLVGAPADKNKLKAAILVCHGEADHLVPQPQVEAFRKSMDSIGANYTFKSYPNATHALQIPTLPSWARSSTFPSLTTLQPTAPRGSI
jgi:dienelactone hydrolase